MFRSLAAVVVRRGWLVVLGWLVFAVALRAIAPAWESVSRDDDVRFFPAGYPSVIGQDLVERGFPADASGSEAVVIAARPTGPLTTDDFAYVNLVADSLDTLRTVKLEDVVAEFEARATEDSAVMARELRSLNGAIGGLGVKKVVDHRALGIGPRLIGTGPDGRGQAVLTIVALKGTYQSKQSRVTVNLLEDMLARLPAPPEGLRLAMTGSAAIGHDLNVASNSSVHKTTWATVGLVVVILLVVYRSPLLALLPLVTIALSVQTSLWGIAALTRVPGIDFQVINITNVFVIVVLFGAGTDYCLFLIARYREELARGRTGVDALRHAIEQVGGALVASAGTVICGLGMLWFSSFAKIQYTGPAIGLSLAISLVACLTLAPVLLRWLRGSVFWPFRPPHHERGHDREAESLEQIPMSAFWGRVANVVIRRPGLILSASLVALTPFAIIGSQTRSNYSQIDDLGDEQPSIVGTRVVQRYFSVGELSPTSVLVAHPEINFRSDAGREAVASLSARLAALPSVAEVRSASRPLGKPEPSGEQLGLVERIRRQATRALADPRYVSTAAASSADRDHITRIELVFRSDPFSDAGLRALEESKQVVARAVAPGGELAGASAWGLSGSTAMIDDLKRVTTLDEQRMYVLVTLGVYVILVLLLRRPGICLYLIATVVIGYLASLGMTELVFMALHTGPEPWVGLDWKVGFFLFVILVAVGEDYNIFLMSRVLEEERKHGAIEGTRLAVAHTGGIISSCGLIMAGTFASMLTGSLNTLRQLGFALALGVLLDTFVVRPILVPAFVVLLERFRVGFRPLSSAHPEALEQAGATTSPSTR